MALSERLQTALDELRMQMLATEVLFGFQLEGTFKEGLGHLSSAARVVDAAALTSVVLALTVMIAAPAQHRLVERGDASLRLLHATQRHAAFALLFLAIAVGGDMYVVASFYLGEAISICLSIGVFGAAIALWFLLGFWSKASVPKDMLSTNEAIPLHEKIKQMLHESWIVLPGATGIFGFQLIITMTPAFESLSRAIQVLHFIALVLIALGVIALVSPAAVHRLAFSDMTVRYSPAESDSRTFGGNSNWRGPIWFPVNFLIIESLQKFHHYYGDDFKVECPTGSGNYLTLEQVAAELSRRLSLIFLKDPAGNRPVLRHYPQLQTDPYYQDCIPFYEFFDGDDGHGAGASHQTGWTGLIAKLLMPRPGE